MEMVAGAMLVAAACVAVGFVTLRGAGAAAQVMTQMFSSPADLGWPTGVQEDDDFHWRWSGRPQVPGESEVGSGRPLAARGLGLDDDARAARPELVELPGGTGPQPLPVARH